MTHSLSKSHVALVVLDIDYFKCINDEFGHPTEDAVICELVSRVQGVLNGTGDIGWVGGRGVLPGSGCGADGGNRCKPESIAACRLAPAAGDGKLRCELVSPGNPLRGCVWQCRCGTVRGQASGTKSHHARGKLQREGVLNHESPGEVQPRKTSMYLFKILGCQGAGVKITLYQRAAMPGQKMWLAWKERQRWLDRH